MTLTGLWREDIESAEFIEAVTAPVRTISHRVAMVDRLGNEVADVPAAGVGVSFQGESAEQWAATITLTDPDWVPRSPRDYLDPRSGLRCRVYWRILVDAAWVEVPIGTYHLEDPDINDDGAKIDIKVTGRDAVATARRGGYGAATIAVGGYTVDAALRRIFEAICPTLPTRVESSTVTLPSTYELGASDDPWDDVTDIAAMAGFRVRADREGTIVAAPAPEPVNLRADLQEGEGCAVVALSRGIKTSSIVNRVIAVSTSPEVNPPITATIEDDDPGSPTWIGGYGPFVTTIKSDKIATQEGAEGMARATYERWRRPMESLRMTIPQRPDLGYRDLVAAGRAVAGVSGLVRVSSWSVQLASPDQAPAPMEVSFMTRSMA